MLITGGKFGSDYEEKELTRNSLKIKKSIFLRQSSFLPSACYLHPCNNIQFKILDLFIKNIYLQQSLFLLMIVSLISFVNIMFPIHIYHIHVYITFTEAVYLRFVLTALHGPSGYISGMCCLTSIRFKIIFFLLQIIYHSFNSVG